MRNANLYNIKKTIIFAPKSSKMTKNPFRIYGHNGPE